MDKTVTIQDLKKKIYDFCDERDWYQWHTPKELAIGVITEASELLEHFRFRSDEEMQAMFDDLEKRAEIESEVADVFFFLLRFCERFDVDLSDALQRKIEKNAEKYPVALAKGSNKKYTEFGRV